MKTQNPRYDFEIEKIKQKKITFHGVRNPGDSFSLSLSRTFLDSVGSKGKTHLAKKLEDRD
jgi:hypothetical protein